MTDETVRQLVAQAVQQTYQQWAAEHPSLASVIDQIHLTDIVVESLRDCQEYRQAVEAYHKGLSEIDLLNRLIELAGPLLTALLAG